MCSSIIPSFGAMAGAVAQGIIWGSMALGVYITFKILDFADMTVDGSFALGGCICALLIYNNVNPMVAALAATLCGSLAGMITGLLTTKLEIPGILSGILMMLALYSINLHIIGGANLAVGTAAVTGEGVKEHFTAMNYLIHWFDLKTKFPYDYQTVSGLITGVVFVAAIIAILYWFFGTEAGCAIRSTGDNKNMSRAQGINTDSTQILALMIANALVALSGALVTQQQRVGDVQMGIGAIVIGLASIIIGEVIFGNHFGFWWSLLAVVLGSVVYRIIIAIVLQLGMKTTDLKLLSASIVAFALAVPVIKQKVSQKRKKIVSTTSQTLKNQNDK